jgi:hypothetical protein
MNMAGRDFLTNRSEGQQFLSRPPQGSASASAVMRPMRAKAPVQVSPLWTRALFWGPNSENCS